MAVLSLHACGIDKSPAQSKEHSARGSRKEAHFGGPGGCGFPAFAAAAAAAASSSICFLISSAACSDKVQLHHAVSENWEHEATEAPKFV